MIIDPAKRHIRFSDWTRTLKIGSAGERFAHLRIYDVPNVDFGSVADGAVGSLSMTCTGVALGDVVLGVSANVDIGDKVVLQGQITTADAVKVTMYNNSGAPVDLADTVDYKIAVLDLT